MSFASKYLKKQQQVYDISLPIQKKVELTIIIPSYNETQVLSTINSLWECTPIKSCVDVIVVVNESEVDGDDIFENNNKTISQLEDFAHQNNNRNIRLGVISARKLAKKWAGAGLARKIAMDAVVARYNSVDQPEGVIVSLDADCVVAPNYLEVIYGYFRQSKKRHCATIYFEHPLPSQINIREGIILYELYMRYYKYSLSYAGLPNAIYTIGSAFAVTANAYIKQGGMSRNKAGEDFYFLQKQLQLGDIGQISDTTVYPEARLSNRVPFGTGPVLQQWVDGQKKLDKTYSFESFEHLRCWLAQTETLYRTTPQELEAIIEQQPESIRTFLSENNWIEPIVDLSKNCSSVSVFTKRYWHLFNAFQILKYLNWSREHYVADSCLINNCKVLLKKRGVEMPINVNSEQLLLIMRKLDKD